MGYDKTEKPTPKKLREAKRRGEVPKSNTLASAIMIFLGSVFLYFISSKLYSGFQGIFFCSFQGSSIEPHLFRQVISPMLLFLFAILGVALLSHFIQQGWVFAWTKIQDYEFSRWEAILFLIKLSLLGLLVTACIFFSLHPPLFLSSSEKFSYIFRRAFLTIFAFSLALLILGGIDYFVQRKRFFDSKKMSQEEIKREKQQTEGDQFTKGRMRRR